MQTRVKGIEENCETLKDLKFIYSYIKSFEVDRAVDLKIQDCFKPMWKDARFKKVKLNNHFVAMPVRFINSKKRQNEAPWIKYLDEDDVVEFFKKKDLSDSKTIINSLEKYSYDPLSKIIKALIYFHKQNKAKARSEILGLLEIYPEEASLYGFETNLAIDQRASNLALTILDFLYEKEEFSEIIDLVAIHLHRNINTNFSKELTYRYDVNLSSLDLERKTSSINYAFKFPGVWFSYIQERKNILAAERFLRKSLKLFPESISRSPFIFKNYFPASEELRSKIFPLVVKPLLLQDDQFSEYRKVELMENAVIKRWVEGQNKKGVIPYFKLRREFYRKLILENKAIDLSLYHLFELGDEEYDYFQWIN